MNRVQIDDKLRGDAVICRQGIDTDFWRLVKEILADLRNQAKEKLVVVDPTDTSAIAQCQATAKISDKLVSIVEETAALLDS